MQIIKCDKGGYGDSVNFVDGDDVFVGYDLMQNCCEQAGWFLSPSLIQKLAYRDKDHGGLDELELEEYDPSGYSFDQSFFEEVEWEALEAGAAAVFRLTHASKDDLHLYLFNNHNGYYSHGFTYRMNGEESGGVL